MALGQGRRTALRPSLTRAERELLTLTQQVGSATITPQLRLRACIILLLDQGWTIAPLRSTSAWHGKLSISGLALAGAGLARLAGPEARLCPTAEGVTEGGFECSM